MSPVDDRYRIGQTPEAISEALFITGRSYGITDRIEVDEQVAIARSLAATLHARSGPLKRADIDNAFRKFEMRLPPRGFAHDVIVRLERLDR